MRIARNNPRALIDQVVADAGRIVKDANLGQAVIDAGDKARLPAAFAQIVDAFHAQGQTRVVTDDVVAALRQKLEAGLATSLQQGALVAADLSADVAQLLSTTPVGVQALAMLDVNHGPVDVPTAQALVQDALTQATPDVASQVQVLQTLKTAEQAHKSDNPTSDVAQQLGTLVKDRGTLMRRAVDNVLDAAQQQFDRVGSEPARLDLGRALDAAQQVYQAVNPKSAGLRALHKKAADLGFVPGADQKAARPFFARFLENQNAQRAQQQTGDVEKTTKKFPSDAEDSGGGETGPVMETRKYPSDNEDGGAGNEGGVMVTMKAPSDNEDTMSEGPRMETRKYPSDHEDGGADVGGLGGGVAVTEKAPSDEEDMGGGDVGGAVTEKYPSDHEDGGGGADDVGDMVTLKYPSDNEDGGGDDRIGDDIATEKYPSDADEDVGDIGDAVTAKYPSDNEDGGGAEDGGGVTYSTMKFPSDNEDGGR